MRHTDGVYLDNQPELITTSAISFGYNNDPKNSTNNFTERRESFSTMHLTNSFIAPPVELSATGDRNVAVVPTSARMEGGWNYSQNQTGPQATRARELRY